MHPAQRRHIKQFIWKCARQFIYFDKLFFFFCFRWTERTNGGTEKTMIKCSLSIALASIYSMRSNWLHAFKKRTALSLCVRRAATVCNDIANRFQYYVRARHASEIRTTKVEQQKRKKKQIETILFTARRNHDKCTCECLDSLCVLSWKWSVCRQLIHKHSTPHWRTNRPHSFVERKTFLCFLCFSFFVCSKFIFNARSIHFDKINKTKTNRPRGIDPLGCDVCLLVYTGGGVPCGATVTGWTMTCCSCDSHRPKTRMALNIIRRWAQTVTTDGHVARLPLSLLYWPSHKYRLCLFSTLQRS